MKGLKNFLAVAMIVTATALTGCGNSEPISYDEMEAALTTAVEGSSGIKIYVTNPSSLTNGEAAEHTDDPCEMSIHVFMEASEDYINPVKVVDLLRDTIKSNKNLYGRITIYESVTADHAAYIIDSGLPYTKWRKNGMDALLVDKLTFKDGVIYEQDVLTE